MKAVLISIRPKWCELIANGQKTIEVRKTRPKIETPFKCYIYCTLDGGIKGDILLKDGQVSKVVCGMVIGEFVCDGIVDIKPFGFDDIERFEKQTCLTSSDIVRYLDGFYGYGWHISDLKIYDKPRELSEFHKPCKYGGDRDFPCVMCKKSGSIRFGEIQCFNLITRPPQSWCYVEEV